MENKETRLWVLMAKKIAGEATAAELNELGELISRLHIQPADEELLNRLWKTPLKSSGTPSIDIDQNWHNLSHSIFPEKSHFYLAPIDDGRKVKPSHKKAWLYAASLIFIVISFTMGTYLLTGPASKLSVKKEGGAPNQVFTKNGSKTSVDLPDGTKVRLNAGSKIYYDNDFINRREVYLTGEAYFDVTHQTESPFIIHAANVNIKVLGTAFNVKAYEEDDQVETALVRGSVELTTNDDPERKILLRPNEKIAIFKNKNITDSVTRNSASVKSSYKQEELYSISRMEIDRKDSVLQDIAWMKDRLIFKGELFAQLAKRMERWYGVNFAFRDETCAKIKFTGEFDNQNIVQALDALAFSCNYKFSYSFDKNKVIILPK